MSNLELALRYINIFFSGGDFDDLAEIFSEDLVFEGPFFRSDSSLAYIDSLKKDPPTGCEYRLIRAFEGAGSVNLIYEFLKGEIRTPMSQLFEFNDGKISRILLIFDTAAFP